MEEDLRNLSSEELLRRWKAGEQRAAEVVVERYAVRLVALIASRMNRRWRGQCDPEDIVQSAAGSFFAAIADSRLRVSGPLAVWQVLATFAKRKMLRAIERQSAIKRGGAWKRIALENVLVPSASLSPTPDVESLMDTVLAREGKAASLMRRVLEELSMGKTQAEIASHLKTSERTVRRCLERLRRLMTEDHANKVNSEEAYLPQSLRRWHYGSFVLRRMIGQGAFGKVYQAYSQGSLLQIFTVKFLKKEFWQAGKARELFLKEVDHAARINHPAIVRYLGWGLSPHGGPFIVQQWIDGKPLMQYRHIAPERMVEYLLQTCDALEAIHAADVVHGDLTPNNVLIDVHGAARITDFGFAQSISAPLLREASSGAAEPHGGTLGFAAPEQISNAFGALGPRTDIFALGALAYWYLSGRAPFAADTMHGALERTLQFEAESMRVTANESDATRALKRVASHCLKRTVAERPSSASGVKRLLGLGP